MDFSRVTSEPTLDGASVFGRGRVDRRYLRKSRNTYWQFEPSMNSPQSVSCNAKILKAYGQFRILERKSHCMGIGYSRPQEASHKPWSKEGLKRVKGNLEAWALSSESSLASEIFADFVTNGTLSFEELSNQVLAGRRENLDLAWLIKLARVLALQSLDAKNWEFIKSALLMGANYCHNSKLVDIAIKLLVEIYISEGSRGDAVAILDAHPRVDRMYHNYLRADVDNPFLWGDQCSFDDWLEEFNKPFVYHGLSQISVDTSLQNPFTTLKSASEPPAKSGPLVSVILTTFEAQESEIRASVNSILNQTWKNIQLLIVDDCSSKSDPMILDNLAATDSRAELIRLTTNGGTYRARNVGLRRARGKYVTGQDSDDWSHPERIERQVRFLENDYGSTGVMVTANRMTNRMLKSSIGSSPQRRCEVSLMLRTEVAKAVGGYLPVRKAADSEFRSRIETWTKKSITTLDEPLYLIRMTEGSLSRSDFRTGWSHPARRSFWSSYTQWHSTARRGELNVGAIHGREELPFPPPSRMLGGKKEAEAVDICFVGDWRGIGPLQRAATDEMKALVRKGFRVAILQFESPFTEVIEPRRLGHDIQEALNRGTISQVFADSTNCVRLAIVRDPCVLQYGRLERSGLQAEKVIVVGHGVETGLGSGIQDFDFGLVAHAARTVFGTNVSWVLHEGMDRGRFELDHGESVIPVEYPLIIDSERFEGSRMNSRGSAIRIGRSAINSEEHWPKRSELEQLYPLGGEFEIRVIGDARGALRVAKMSVLPDSWIAFRRGIIRAEVFWRTIDVMVQFDRMDGTLHSRRDLLEAMAAGVPVIADEKYSHFFGDRIIAQLPADVPEILRSGMTNLQDYYFQSDKTKNYVGKNFSPQKMVTFVHAIFETADS